MRTWHSAKTQAEQLAVLNETGIGGFLYQFKNPSDAVINRALDLNGNVIQYISRPTLSQQLRAVTQNPYAIKFCPPKNRGKDAQGNETVTAVHADVQSAAFLEPLTILAYPEKFDSDIENGVKRPGLLAFGRKIIRAYQEAIGDDPIHPGDQENLRTAINDFVVEGREDIPLLSWYKAHYKDYDFTAIEGLSQKHFERIRLIRDMVRGTKVSADEIKKADEALRGLGDLTAPER